MHVYAESSASSERLFDVVSDVTSWPDLLSTFTSVTPADDSPRAMRIGARFDVRQPRLPDATWEITELTPGHSFTWMARARGVTSTAMHRVSALPSGSRIDLELEWSGPLAPGVRLVLARRAASMIQLEATTFAQVAEQRE